LYTITQAHQLCKYICKNMALYKFVMRNYNVFISIMYKYSITLLIIKMPADNNADIVNINSWTFLLRPPDSYQYHKSHSINVYLLF